MTQLIFEHSLRIRLKAETEAKSTAPAAGSAISPSAPASQPNTGASQSTATTTVGSADTSQRTSKSDAMIAATHVNAKASSSESTPAKSTSTSGAPGDAIPSSSVFFIPLTVLSTMAVSTNAFPKKQESTKNLSGHLNTLITTDLKGITNGREWIRTCITTPGTIIFCVWFLYQILGWRYVISLSVSRSSFLLSGFLGYIG
jgi:hypothetical protein